MQVQQRPRSHSLYDPSLYDLNWALEEARIEVYRKGRCAGRERHAERKN